MANEVAVKNTWLLGDDMTGKTSGWLEVIGPAERPEGASVKFRGTWWRCRCKCGNEKVFPRQYITQKTVTSCGCKKRGPKIDVDQKTLIAAKEKPKRVRKNPPRLATSCEELAKTCKCAACGKTFERLSYDWSYKRSVGGKMYWFCTWKCLRSVTCRQDELKAAQA